MPRKPAPAPVASERDDDSALVAEFSRLVDRQGRINAFDLFTVLDRTVWEDHIGDKRTSRALRTALTPLKGSKS